VKNAADAMRLLYQVIKDPTALTQAITLLRMALNQLLANAHKTVQDFLNKILPKTVTLKDFFKTLFIYAGVAGLNKIDSKIINMQLDTGSVVKNVLDRFISLDSIVDNLVSAGAGNIMQIVDGLKLAHDLFFDVLSRIAKKLGSVRVSKSGGVINLAKVVEARGRKPGGWCLIKMVNSKHQPTEAVTADNYDEMTSFYANPHPKHAYLGFVNSVGEVTHHLVTNSANQINTAPGKPW
jgi:hypothetical protein